MDSLHKLSTSPNVAQDDLLFHDEKAANSQLAFLLSRMRHPEFPEPIGVFRAVDRPTYDEMINSQVADAKSENGDGDLAKLFASGETWDGYLTDVGSRFW